MMMAIILCSIGGGRGQKDLQKQDVLFLSVGRLFPLPFVVKYNGEENDVDIHQEAR